MSAATSTLAERLRAAVDDLAADCNTADDLAAKLTAEGIRGTPRCPEICPVAVALTRRLGQSVEAASAAAYACDDECEAWAPLPRLVRKFICGFDDGDRWPQLHSAAAS